MDQDFTSRTHAVLNHFAAALRPAESPPSKKRRLSNGSVKQQSGETPSTELNATLKGKSRLYASAVFLELLVLKSKGFVELEQDKPLADIRVTQGPRLTGGQ